MHGRIDRALGKRLARAREDCGLRQDDIAEVLGTELYAISRYESGRRHLPHGKTLTDYVKALEQITDKTADELGLADLVEAAA